MTGPHLAHHRTGRISYQVLQELCATLTRKLRPAFDVAEAGGIVRELAAWRPPTSRSCNGHGGRRSGISFRGGTRWLSLYQRRNPAHARYCLPRTCNMVRHSVRPGPSIPSHGRNEPRKTWWRRCERRRPRTTAVQRDADRFILEAAAEVASREHLRLFRGLAAVRHQGRRLRISACERATPNRQTGFGAANAARSAPARHVLFRGRKPSAKMAGRRTPGQRSPEPPLFAV